MATTAKATGFLELNISGFDQALKTAKNLMVTFAAGFGAYKLADFFKDGIKEAINFGKEMQNASRVMHGFDPGSLLLVQKALEKTGMGAEEARGHMQDFIEQGRHVSDLFGGTEDYAAALKDAAKDYGNQADILTRSGKALMEVWNKIEAISSKVKEFFLSMVEQFIDPLKAALDALRGIDLTKIGREFGESIAKAATVLLGLFKNGDVVNTFTTGIKLGMMEAVNVLYEGIVKTADYIREHFQESIGMAWEKSIAYATELLNSEFIATLQLGLLSAASAFLAAMSLGVNEIGKYLESKWVKFVKSHGPGSAFHENDLPGTPERGAIDPEFIRGLQGQSAKGAEEIMEKIAAAAAGFYQTITTNSANTGDEGAGGEKIFNTSEVKSQLADIIARGMQTGGQMIEDSKGGELEDKKKNLTVYSATRAGAIADNLARVGGGGNFLKVGQSLQERTLMMSLRAQREQLEVQKAIKENTATKPPQPNMGR